MKLSYLALALGTFGLGMTEYGMMGILPDLAQDIKVPIPVAGHFISYYAIGVCVGAPLMVIVARKLSLKNILLLLMAVFIIGNLAFSLSHSYASMSVWRFIAGFPHGAYFGVGSIVASQLAGKGKEGSAVAAMISGMTVANLVGVPLGTFLGSHFTWRVVYYIVAAWGLLTMMALFRWIPNIRPLPDNGFRGQFRFLKNWAPWILVLAITFGNGGIFSWYSYVSKAMTEVSGFQESSMGIIMVLGGLGMVIGNFISGKLTDMYSPVKVAMVTQGLVILIMVMIFFWSHFAIAGLLLLFMSTACLFALSAPQQILVLKNSEGGEMLGGSLAQIGFNLGNAIGAYVGGIPVTMGYSYEFTAVPGVFLAIFGFMLLFTYSMNGKNFRKHHINIL
ncbi:MFS transporter AraJ [Weeksellaceae bacterium A-14]|uniref:MFS transporter AraJ n=1 Tax=Daejeonia sp. YH14 TaxID=3439042 RepID=UPI0031E4C88E